MIFFRRVVGNSMVPTLREGQIVWAHGFRSFKPGQIVIACVNGREIIKRIDSISGGKVFLLGDNETKSTDSRKFGSIPDTNIEGVVFWPKH